MSSLVSLFPLLLAIGSGLVAGVLFAFSSFIMRALEGLPPPYGAEAMRAINVAVVPSSFIALFVALALGSLAASLLALFRWQAPASAWLLAGGLIYLVGVFGVTILVNVPLNDRLAAALPETLGATWKDYLRDWTRWNTFRTAAGVGSSLAFMVAFNLS